MSIDSYKGFDALLVASYSKDGLCKPGFVWTIARLGLQQRNYFMYPVAMIFFFNGELEMDIVCVLGICFPSKHQVPIDVAVTAHQVPGPTAYSVNKVSCSRKH